VRRPGRGAAAALLRGAQELWDGIARRGYHGAVEIKMSKTLRLTIAAGNILSGRTIAAGNILSELSPSMVKRIEVLKSWEVTKTGNCTHFGSRRTLVRYSHGMT
jgi:hypothetical protein